MENSYEVMLGTQSVGKVQLIRQGLYCRVICRCRASQEQVFRLYADVAGREENLGIPVPEGDGLFLDRRIPVKRLGEGKLRFFLSSGSCSVEGRFVSISPEEPFLYITRLKTAFLQSEHGKVGIMIEDHPEAV